MEEPKRRSGKRERGRKRGKSFFLRGIVAILPAVLTLFILITVVRFAQDYITRPINTVIYWSLERNGLGWGVLYQLDIDPLADAFLDPNALPANVQALIEPGGDLAKSPLFRSELDILRAANTSFFRDLEALAINPYKLRREVGAVVHPIFGVLVSVLLVLTVGYLASGFLGRRVISGMDKTMHQIPVIRSVYPYTKQLVEFFLSETELDFDTVVAAPYPSENVWCIAFVTSQGLKTVHEQLGGRYVSCFVPTSPVPMTGFTVFIEAKRLIPLPLTVDEALRVTISAGVLIPPAERVADLKGELVARLATAHDDDQSGREHGSDGRPEAHA